MKRARELDAVLTGDPTRGREALRRLFDDGHIRVTPQPGGTYVAESTLLPMMLFAPDVQSTAPPTTSGRGRSFTAISCAGLQRCFLARGKARENGVLGADRDGRLARKAALGKNSRKRS